MPINSINHNWTLMINMKVETIITIVGPRLFTSHVRLRLALSVTNPVWIYEFSQAMDASCFPLSPRNVELLLLDKEPGRVRRLKCPCLRLRRLKWLTLTLTLILTGRAWSASASCADQRRRQTTSDHGSDLGQQINLACGHNCLVTRSGFRVARFSTWWSPLFDVGCSTPVQSITV